MFSVAIFWLIKPTTPAQHIHKQMQTIKVQVKASEPKASQPETVAQGGGQIATALTPQPPSTHEELMKAAGISPEDYGAADYIITHESGWNPEATEPTSGAHGLPQALPYSKTGCGWSDSICQLQWANDYAVARYGGWWKAQAYWSVNRNW